MKKHKVTSMGSITITLGLVKDLHWDIITSQFLTKLSLTSNYLRTIPQVLSDKYFWWQSSSHNLCLETQKQLLLSPTNMMPHITHINILWSVQKYICIITHPKHLKTKSLSIHFLRQKINRENERRPTKDSTNVLLSAEETFHWFTLCFFAFDYVPKLIWRQIKEKNPQILKPEMAVR